MPSSSATACWAASRRAASCTSGRVGPKTVWVSIPKSYAARCANSGGAHVLEVTAVYGAQTPTPAPTPAWGLHLLDANIALGNPVSIVHTEAAAYTARHAAAGGPPFTG